MNREQVLSILETIKLGNSQTLGASNILQELSVQNNTVLITLAISNPTLQFKNKVRSEIEHKITEQFPKTAVKINFIMRSSNDSEIRSGIKNIIAIASGKGGVGKSTIASNLAVALQSKGHSVGLVDADIYGPSIPLMFDVENERPKAVNKNQQSLMSPVVSYGVKLMSIGFFSSPNDAIVFRGPMATKALKQIIQQTDWGDLDYLLIDLPPGTGDIHLSLVQTLSLTGSIIITTPQPVSVIDAKKAISMFKKKEINVPILGLIENMSWLSIGGNKHYIFGQDGGQALADSAGIPLLAQIPLEQTIREAGDVGRPAVLQQGLLANLFATLVETMDISINKRTQELPPTKKVEIIHNRGCN